MKKQSKFYLFILNHKNDSITSIARKTNISLKQFKRWRKSQNYPDLFNLRKIFSCLNLNLYDFNLSELFDDPKNFKCAYPTKIEKIKKDDFKLFYTFILRRLEELDSFEEDITHSINWLAEKSNITKKAIQNWQKTDPRMDNVLKIIDALYLNYDDVRLSFILDYSELNDEPKTSQSKVVNLCIFFILFLLFSISFGQTLSYFFQNKILQDIFTFGEVKIDVAEPKWDDLEDTNDNDIPDKAENFVPSQVIDKDPTITNIGNNDAYVYFEVVVPTADNIVVADTNGNRLDTTDEIELWTFSVNEGWTQLSKTVNKDNTVTYVYCANDALSSGSSVTLFDTVTMANVIEGQGLEDTEQVITAKGMAIQTELVENPIDGFEKYLRQKGE